MSYYRDAFRRCPRALISESFASLALRGEERLRKTEQLLLRLGNERRDTKFRYRDRSSNFYFERSGFSDECDWILDSRQSKMILHSRRMTVVGSESRPDHNKVFQRRHKVEIPLECHAAKLDRTTNSLPMLGMGFFNGRDTLHVGDH